MSKQLEVGIAADAGAFDKGIRSGVIEPLEDAEKALEELGRADGTDKLERSLRDAQDETERLADETKETARIIEREYRDSYDSADQSARRGLDGMSDKATEVGSELRANLGETFSSFRGDLEDLPQIAQDTLGGLAGSGALGGIPGLVATAAGAAGIGLLIGAFETLGEEQEKLEESTREWSEAYIESGSRVLSTATLIARGQSILNERYSEAETNAKNWGVEIDTAVAAMAGSETAIATVSASLEDQGRAAADNAREAQAMAEANGSALLSLTPLERAYQDGVAALDTLTGGMDRGGQRADIYSNFLRDLAANTAGATTEVDELGDAVTTLPDGTQIYIDAETGQATTDVNAIENKVYGLPDRVPITVDINTAEAYAAMDRLRQNLQNKGITVPIIAGYIGKEWN